MIHNILLSFLCSQTINIAEETQKFLFLKLGSYRRISAVSTEFSETNSIRWIFVVWIGCRISAARSTEMRRRFKRRISDLSNLISYISGAV